MSEAQGYTDDAAPFAAMNAISLMDSGKHALDVAFGVQKVVLDEMAKASGEVLERVRAEIEIASEFVARMASAHSVKEIATVCNDCGQHQAEAFRQDSQMLFRHSQRLYEQTSKLFASAQRPAS
ncbi:MAG: phasin family protein [Xanthobacteraceae bacterium]|nr:phasin family protein [Xanthobacteraceae bacterium]